MTLSTSERKRLASGGAPLQRPEANWYSLEIYYFDVGLGSWTEHTMFFGISLSMGTNLTVVEQALGPDTVFRCFIISSVLTILTIIGGVFLLYYRYRWFSDTVWNWYVDITKPKPTLLQN